MITEIILGFLFIIIFAFLISANLPVELLVVAIIVLILFFWSIWFRITTGRYMKKYSYDNDISRKGGEKFGEFKTTRGESVIPKAVGVISRPPEPAKRILLPTANSDKLGKDSRRHRIIFTRRK